MQLTNIIVVLFLIKCNYFEVYSLASSKDEENSISYFEPRFQLPLALSSGY
jgi:hypothetical protein